VSGGRDLTIKLWSLPQSELSCNTFLSLQSKLTQKAHDKEIQSLAVSPNDKLIASGSRDKKAKVVILWKKYLCNFNVIIPNLVYQTQYYCSSVKILGPFNIIRYSQS